MKTSIKPRHRIAAYLGTCALFAAVITLEACKPSHAPLPDVANIAAPVHLHRFEQSLFALDTTSKPALEAAVAKLLNENPTFSEIFTANVMGMKHANAPIAEAVPLLADWVRIPAVRHLKDTATAVYAQLDDVQRELEQSFKYMKYYFPKRRTPEVFTYVSGCQTGVFTVGDSIVGVGLDFFFGPKFAPYYTLSNPLPEYVTNTLTRPHIAAYVMNAEVEDIVSTNGTMGNRCLDQIIETGKKWYILEQLTPLMHDSLRTGFTAKQVTWCATNEREMWAFFTEQKLLYSTDTKKIRKYFEPSPSSPGMPTEAPGRTGTWLGREIIRAYITRHPEVTLPELVREHDAQKIMTESRYKPAR